MGGDEKRDTGNPDKVGWEQGVVVKVRRWCVGVSVLVVR